MNFSDNKSLSHFKIMFISNLPYKNVDNIVKNSKLIFGGKEMFAITLP